MQDHEPEKPVTVAGARSRSDHWRWLIAIALSVVGLIAIIIFGPDEQSIKDRFEYYGTPDEIHIMSEISIDDGADLSHQLPKSLQLPPPPSQVEYDQEEPDEDGTEPMPEKSPTKPNEVEFKFPETQEESEKSEDYQVEMALPMQSNPDFFIEHIVRPVYPMGATELERRTPVIVVRIGLFVTKDGAVSEAMILGSTGSEVFDQAALVAVKQWRFSWRVDPGVGRWLQFPFNFKSPYFSSAR